MAYNEDGTLWHSADMYLDYKHRFDLIDFWCLNATFNNISDSLNATFNNISDISWRPSLDLATHTSLSSIRRGFTPGFGNYKKGALDSSPQVIKFISCLPIIGGSLRLLPHRILSNNTS
jgi:hypothetical protein